MDLDFKYDIFDKLALKIEINNKIETSLYDKYKVKRGLRNENGTGVLVGLTKVGSVNGYKVLDGKKVSMEGILDYRGMNVKEVVTGFQKDKRHGFEETSYLLLFGKLPNREELQEFKIILSNFRQVPDAFIEDMILKFPSNDIMNKLQRSILASYSIDPNPDDISVKALMEQSLKLIARFPLFVAYGYQAKAHYYDKKSLYLHAAQQNLDTAENILYLIRPDNKFTEKEAELLDLSLVLHSEHGGGNNSTFATHVVSSSGTDTYSAISAAVGCLKGPKHGGANLKVYEMITNIRENVCNWNNREALKDYLYKILRKEAFDGKGLIYGMGHAIYTLSDPRAVLLKEKALELAKEKNRIAEFDLYKNIEELTKEIFKEQRDGKDICANVDLYSGFVYEMLNIPRELYTPLFATARISGWCAHRIEQIISETRIIRPAYENVAIEQDYTELNNRF
ncbi:citrate/2-methylcitrate synthase [Clostridium grantii]|uniref:citrate synthase (unknown stereospecificity) n=1 Tax=Clostridium grantii DSM 8605 TaxID=1121316 RepID=A0A1M5XEL6_9CLOT|nr:citrate/2-methylcitrate synthase [Clostridium grantii]SHH97643.1 citrate synthase [Clostridium grantii DSM 8605]